MGVAQLLPPLAEASGSDSEGFAGKLALALLGAVLALAGKAMVEGVRRWYTRTCLSVSAVKLYHTTEKSMKVFWQLRICNDSPFPIRNCVLYLTMFRVGETGSDVELVSEQPLVWMATPGEETTENKADIFPGENRGIFFVHYAGNQHNPGWLGFQPHLLFQDAHGDHRELDHQDLRRIGLRHKYLCTLKVVSEELQPKLFQAVVRGQPTLWVGMTDCTAQSTAVSSEIELVETRIESDPSVDRR